MATKANGTEPTDVENLYHVLLSTSHIQRDPTGAIEKLQVCATFTDLKAAKAEAHKTLFEAGYEREWFTVYDTNQAEFAAHHVKRRTGLAVYAKAQDGTVFRSYVATTPNTQGFQSDAEDHKIHFPLYHVIETIVLYDEDDSGEARETNVEGSFRTYEEARQFASQVLLAPESGVTKDSFAQYDEAGPSEKDCGYGENVVVHAVGGNGENLLVSVLKGQELESVRLAEAAIRIRSN
ncbi:hypothetical protein CLCR_09071 [Cladophialophora carrionii]|uniref:Uncharacterized protein n=1 Tax=Cladophialophora carrionii TaxID=86049 RepID=A0A1C1CTC6_9EURO|nr:hypothetical protein CLCR_09071 [Cladophialophora carrionii]